MAVIGQDLLEILDSRSSAAVAAGVLQCVVVCSVLQCVAIGFI